MNIFLEDIKKVKFSSVETTTLGHIEGRLTCSSEILVNDLHFVHTQLKLPINIYNNNYKRWYDLHHMYSLKFLKQSEKARYIYSRIYGV